MATEKQQVAECQSGDPPAVLVPTEVLAFLRMAADPTRLHLLALLARSELPVGAIAAALATRPNLISHHLTALSKQGLLQRRRQGRWVYYRAEPQILGGRVGALAALLATRRPDGRSARQSAHDIA